MKFRTALEILWNLRHSRVDQEILLELWKVVDPKSSFLTPQVSNIKHYDRVCQKFLDWKPYRLGSISFRALLKKVLGRDFVEAVFTAGVLGSDRAVELLSLAGLKEKVANCLRAIQESDERRFQRLTEELKLGIVLPTSGAFGQIGPDSEVVILSLPLPSPKGAEEAEKISSELQIEASPHDLLFFSLIEVFKELKATGIKPRKIFLGDERLTGPNLKRSSVIERNLIFAASAAAKFYRPQIEFNFLTPIMTFILLRENFPVKPEKFARELFEKVPLGILEESIKPKFFPTDFQLRLFRRSKKLL